MTYIPATLHRVHVHSTLASLRHYQCHNECLSAAQKKDSTLAKCYEEMEGAGVTSKAHSFYLDNGVLPRKWVARPALRQDGGEDDWGMGRQVVVPVGYRSSILKLAHEHPWSGHLGVTKTYCVLQHFLWPGMKKDVSRFCRTCEVCQVVGKPNQTVPPVSLKAYPGGWGTF